MKLLIEMLITFIILFILFYSFYVVKEERRLKDDNKKDDPYPSEIMLLIKLYKVDTKKFNYLKLLRLFVLLISIDLSVLITFVAYIKGIGLQLLIGLISSILVFVLTYIILGLYIKKKGWIKDVK